MANDAAAFSKALGEMPIHSMLESLGKGIVDAQNALDANSIELTRTYADTHVTMLDETGQAVDHSLLDLGLLPTFYHFTEANIEVAMSMSMRAEESLSVGVGIELGATSSRETSTQTDTKTTTDGSTSPSSTGSTGSSSKGGAMFGLSVNVEMSRKFGFDASGATKIRAKLVSVPAPTTFLDVIQTNAASLRA